MALNASLQGATKNVPKTYNVITQFYPLCLESDMGSSFNMTCSIMSVLSQSFY